MNRIGLFCAMALMGGLCCGTQTVSLDGEWKLDYWPQPDDGAIRSLDIPEHRSVRATVPGNCELDLVHAGVLPPAEVGLNALKLRPYEGYQWLVARC